MDTQKTWQPPKRFADYEIIQKIDDGGMGAIYKARHVDSQEVVAIKVMVNDSQYKRFEREAETSKRLNHPNFVRFRKKGEISGKIFIVMDYIEGLPLKKYLEQSLPLDQKFKLFHTILKAIVFAHDTGVIHRDIKPANILVKDSGEPIILDFGLAKCVDFSDKKDETYLTLEGQILGTPGYMSPEQAKGEVEYQDERTDIFSLGIILYEALTGHNPFEGGNVIDICYKIANNPPEPIRTYLPKIPDILEGIINKSLENNIKKRYQTAEEFLYDFEEFLSIKKAHASTPTPLPKPVVKSTPKDGVICLVCGTENNKESLYCSECNQILKKEFHRNDTKKVKILNQDPMTKARKSMPPLVAEPKSLMNIISQNPQHIIEVKREYPEEEKIIPAFTPVEKPKIVQRPISLFELLIGALGFLFSILPIFYMYRFSLSLHIFDFFIGMFSAYLVFESRKYMAAVFIFPLAFIICCCVKNYFGVIGIPFAPSFFPKLAMGSVVTFFYARCLFYMYKL
ncbi:serine/threonine-protein kinase [Candidatus Uabimicrobium amorphum]|uniref:Protein kinase n=1 Tax=Uabimicrobium amorphum TaxID=2596890 RepID=A0A5S9INI1_UABAM|nr:serine/threonine-protein kinase [Candidatus Uabimicrobium amorphum]BBM84974.1 protein kinase [Candidatus Uabimicrobium amorphum]